MMEWLEKIRRAKRKIQEDGQRARPLQLPLPERSEPYLRETLGLTPQHENEGVVDWGVVMVAGIWCRVTTYRIVPKRKSR